MGIIQIAEANNLVDNPRETPSPEILHYTHSTYNNNNKNNLYFLKKKIISD